MAEHEDFYTPEHIDEQVDALLQARGPLLQDQRLASDLHSILQHTAEDEYSLQRVLRKLMEHNNTVQQQEKIVPFAVLRPQQQEQGRFVAMPKTLIQYTTTRHMLPIVRVVSTLAAVLVVMVLVGSMLFVFNATRQKPTSPTGPTTAHTGAVTPTPAEHQGQIIYTSKPFGNLLSLVWSPDGRRVAAVLPMAGEVQSWDARTGQHILTYPTSGDTYIINVAWSPDGTQLAVAGSSKIYLFDVTTAHLRRSFPAPSVALNGNVAPSLVTVSPVQRMVALSPSLSGGGPAFENVSWSPDSKYLAAAFNGSRSVVYVWDATTGAVLKTLTGFHSLTNDMITEVHWSPRGNMLAILVDRSDTTVIETQIWDTATWQVVKRYPYTSEMDWSPDGKQAALVESGISSGKDVRIVDVQNGHTLRRFPSVLGVIVTAVHWSPDGSRIAIETKGMEGLITKEKNRLPKITLWSVTSGTLLYRFPNVHGVDRAAWSPDSKYILSVETGADLNASVHILIWRA